MPEEAMKVCYDALGTGTRRAAAEDCLFTKDSKLPTARPGWPGVPIVALRYVPQAA